MQFVLLVLLEHEGSTVVACLLACLLQSQKLLSPNLLPCWQSLEYSSVLFQPVDVTPVSSDSNFSLPLYSALLLQTRHKTCRVS
ncbi:hypothetical protein B0T09DRAFT_331226 [Sordaria sp. MPI-SDFR-AT-0083]|nr:hypothetical protein B0T09DRAFT_331226 [Sordaria sp. MPI-SDFR-AT-0083]